jgi:hypothetical protein
VSNLSQILELLLLITVPILAIGLSVPFGRALAARFAASTGRFLDETGINPLERRISAEVDARRATPKAGNRRRIASL